MAKSGTNVGGIYGDLVLDDGGFKKVLQQSKGDMAKAALAMQSSSRVKIDVGEWKKLTSQLQALSRRAQETRLALIKTTAGSAEAKELQHELKGIEQRMRLLKSATEPARKELEKLAKVERQESSAGSKKTGFGGAMRDQVVSHLPGGVGVVAGALSSSPVIAAAAAVTASAAAMAGAATAVLRAAKANGEYAESMLNIAQQTGLSTKRIQEFKFVADASGLSFEGLMRGIILMEKNMPSITSGTSAAAKAFERLGLSAKNSDGSLRSMDELYPKVIEKLQRMQNITERNSTAAQIFGRGWAEIAPILGMDADAFSELTKQANELGMVMSAEDLKAAAELDDMFDKLHATVSGLWRQLGIKVTPWLIDMLQKLQGILPSVMDRLKQLWVNAQPGFSALWKAMKQIYQAGKGLLNDAIIPLLSTFTALGDGFKSVLGLSKKLLDAWNRLSPASKMFITNFALIALVAPRIINAIKSIVVAMQALREISLVAAIAGAAATGNWGQIAKIGAGIAVAVAAAAALTAAEMKAFRGIGKTQGSVIDDIKKNMDELSNLFSNKGKLDLADPFEESTADSIGKGVAETVDNTNSALDNYIDQMQETFTRQQEWARNMVDSMRGMANDVLSVVRDQVRRENAERDKTVDANRRRYERLRELGKAGVMAMTDTRMFADKQKSESEISAADLTPELIKNAVQSVIARRKSEADINSIVQKRLYGDSISRYEAVANMSQPDWNDIKDTTKQGSLIDRIVTYVAVLPQMLSELQKTNKTPVSTSF